MDDGVYEEVISGDPVAALGLIERILREQPEDALAHACRGIVLRRLGRLAAARDAALEAIHCAPDLTMAFSLLQELDRESRPVETPARGRVDRRPEWQPGELIDGRWRVLGSEQGGVGIVTFVHDCEWAMDMAMKTQIELPDWSPRQRAQNRDRFRKETRVWLDLGMHPRVVKGFYTLELHGALRFFMERVPGRSLRRILVEQGRIALPRALDFGIQLADAMDFVHEQRALHRDLKPDNCLIVDREGELDNLQVTDFGLATVAEPNLDEHLGTLGPLATGLSRDACGTPAYMPPEQWRGLSHASKQADVYSFGVLFVEMIAGEVRLGEPPADLSPAERVSVRRGGQARMRLLHERATPPSLSSLGVKAPAELEALVASCLAKEPRRRPDFATIRSVMVAAYETVTGHAYTRSLERVTKSEEAENNRAVSYVVLGEATQAARILDDWLGDHPGALYPWMNRQMLALLDGTGRLDDIERQFAGVIRPRSETLFGTQRFRDLVAQLRGTWRAGHPVLSAAHSPDGRRLACVCDDGCVRLWTPISLVDAAHGASLHDELLARFPHGVDQAAVTYTGDGVVALASRGGDCWLLEGGKIAPLCRGGGAITTVALSRGGEHRAIVADEAVELHLQTGNVRVISGWPVTCVAFSHDGARVAAGCRDGALVVVDIATSTLRLLGTISAPVTAIAWSPRDQVVAAGCSDGTTEVWSVDGARRRLDGQGAQVESLAFEPDGRYLVTAAERDLRLWDVDRGALERKVGLHSRRIAWAAFHPAGAEVVSCAEDGVVRRWDLTDTRAVLLLRRPLGVTDRLSCERDVKALTARLAGGDVGAYPPLHRHRVEHPELDSPEVRQVIRRVCGRNGIPIGVRGAHSQTSVRSSHCVAAVAVSEGLLLTATYTPAIRLWSVAEDDLVSSVAQPVRAEAVAIDVRHRHALIAGDGRAWRWDYTGTALVPIDGADDVVFVGVLPGGCALVVGRPCGVWDVTRGRKITHLHAAFAAPTAAAVGAELIAIGDIRGEVGVWHAATGGLSWRNASSDGPIRALALSPDDRRLLAGGDEGARLCNADTGTELARLDHGGPVAAAAFVGGGRVAVTACDDRHLRFWEVPTGRLLLSVDFPSDHLMCMSTATDNEVVTGGRSGATRVWTLDFEWAMAADLEEDVAAVLRGATSRYWPWLAGSGLDGWGDVLRDLRRSSSTLDRRPISQRIAEVLPTRGERRHIFGGRRSRGGVEPALRRLARVDEAVAAEMARACGIHDLRKIGVTRWPR